ncbi:transglutaminase family protein [Carnimonas nigrificans]|uniref:transglutaminase family protein n=1 Tax=Carnimonas nigrificans TaxID=64323 RepID=UPI000471A61D|nr:transglutaminase family protein [Carnimonas nigrificans]
MIYRLRHTTRYEYASMVTLCHSEARMLPRQLPWQHCDESEITIFPITVSRCMHTDVFGNRVLYFSLEEPHQSLGITIDTRIRTSARPAPVDNGRPWRSSLALSVGCQERLDTAMVSVDSPLVVSSDSLRDYALPSFPEHRTALEGVLDLNQRIFNEFSYDPGYTTVATPIDDVLLNRRGVCQDFAHLMIGCLRSLGFPTRYISGYLETLPPPGQPRLIGADASHAWLAVYLPESGWLELDPTNGSLSGEKHIINAWGRDYADVAPLKGVMSGGGSQHLTVSVDVEPLGETSSPP